MQTSTRSSSTDTSSKPLPTVSSILLFQRKKEIFPKVKKGSSSVKSFFKGTTGKTSSPVANISVPKITYSLQLKFQPQEPALTLRKNEQSTLHNQSCAHVQSFPPTSTCASIH